MEIVFHGKLKFLTVLLLILVTSSRNHFMSTAFNGHHTSSSWVGSKYQIDCTMCSACDNPCNTPSPPPPPSTTSICPPPPTRYYYSPPPPSPPSYTYHPPPPVDKGGGGGYYKPPPVFSGPAPPPPNPIMPYFPYYYYNPPSSSSSGSQFKNMRLPFFTTIAALLSRLVLL